MRIVDDQKLILGPPGCGKTHYLLDRIEQLLSRGVPPDRIAFVSFTKKAVREAVTRACEKFHLTPKDFPYFRTVHSMCFRGLGMTKGDMLSKEHYRELGDILGYKFEGTFDDSETGLPQGDEKGDKLLFTDNFARITQQNLHDVWETAGIDCEWAELERLSRTLLRYKDSRLLLDYTDLLARFADRGRPLPVDVGIIDEAQDLSKLQWAALRVAFATCNEVYIAGDDDQSIYKWSGSDLPTFLSLEGEKRVLHQSYRLPKVVFAKAQTIISQVANRFEKPFAPTHEEGFVDNLQTIDMAKLNKDETTLILVRNVYLLNRVTTMLRNNGYPFLTRGGYSSIRQSHVDAILAWEGLNKGKSFPASRIRNMYENMKVGSFLSRGAKVAINNYEGPDLGLADLKDKFGLLRYAIWHEALENMSLQDRAYYLSILHSGQRITQTPKISVNTIHGVKGGEADHVIIMPEMSKRTYLAYQRDPTDEHRVAYVGVTRARRRLSIVQPSSELSYPY